MQAAPVHLAGGEHACLLVHGLAGSPLEVRFIGKLLQRAGFSVYIPVIPGDSMGSEPLPWQRWRDEIARIFADLRARHDTVSVGGLSSGATLALTLAETVPGIQALALWAVTLYYDGWAIPWYRSLFEPAYRLGFGRFYGYREAEPYGLKNERWRARVAEAMRAHKASTAGPALIPSDFLFQSILMGRYAVSHLHRVTCDTVVLHAADDETASPRNADEVFAGIRSVHKRRLMLGDSYHIITMDNERDLVARETIRFFQQSILRVRPQLPLALVSSARALLRLQRRRAARGG
ncbi:MAG: alpha/beta fold hydrolase [Betaproteobacteria bacterium]|nr:alpha/beta fold hydrolase [Betaproteobacteria bacterium]